MGEITRRVFAQGAAAAGVAAVVGTFGGTADAWAGEARGKTADGEAGRTRGQKPEASYDAQTGELSVNRDVLVRYGICSGCYCGCGLRLKVDRETGEVLGQGGNPYNASNAYPTLAFEEPLIEAYKTMTQAPDKKTGAATCCARSLGNLDVYLHADRITVPLKRAGARGEGLWEPISWEQLIEEVVEGGRLFEHLGEDREVEGFRALYTDDLIDPEAPEFGSKRNQVVHFGGRLDGRGMTTNRFYGAFGSRNALSHLATCYGPRDCYYGSQMGFNDLSMDTENVEFAVWCGTFPGANGGSVQNDLKRMTARMQEGTVKVAVFDPNLCSGVVTPTQPNATWYPIKPATNTALALGMARWIIEHDTYDAGFLSAPSRVRSLELGYGAGCNATHLVVVDEAHPRYRCMMTVEDADIAASGIDPEFGAEFVTIDAATGEPASNLSCLRGVLEFEGTVNGVRVKTAFSLFKESVFTRTVEEYAEICGVPADVIADTAREFTSHGPRAAIHGIGGSLTLNGMDAGSIYVVLGTLIGSIQMKGGYVVDYVGCPGVLNERYALAAVEGAPARAAVGYSRTNFAFENTSEYARRVAAGENDPKPLLPWYPRGVSYGDSQGLMSAINQYPYQAKIVVAWQSNTINATPGAMREKVIERLKNPQVVPLIIASDVVEGTWASLADYFVPDLTYRETFGVQGKNQCFHARGSFIAWPMVEPKTALLDDGRHASFDAFLIDIAKRLGMPGYGENAIKSADGMRSYPLNDACDYYLKTFANLAYYGDPVDDIDEDEIDYQGLDLLPASWKEAVEPEEWPKVLKVMSRGCRVWPVEEAYDECGRAVYGVPMMGLLYSEARAVTKNCLSGEFHPGVLTWSSEAFSDASPIGDVYDREAFPFAAASYKPRFRSTSMLSNSAIMRQLAPTNFVEMNIEDARTYGITDGDAVLVENPSGDACEGIAMVRAGTSRGTIGVAFGYGQRAYGSTDVYIGSELRPGNPQVGMGTNIVQMVDPTLAEGTLFAVADCEAGTGGRNGGMFRVTKVGE